MPRKHIIKEGETLLKIAAQYKFKTYYPIYEANKRIIGHNPDMLLPGVEIEIPDKILKAVGRASSYEHEVKIKPLRHSYVWLVLEDNRNSIVTDEKELIITIEKRSIQKYIFVQPISQDSVGRHIHIVLTEPLKLADFAGELKYTVHEFGNKTQHSIELQVGGLDPLQWNTINKSGEINSSGDIAVSIQKMLANLGYYFKKPDGNLQSIESFIAIQSFQRMHGGAVTGKLTNSDLIKLNQAMVVKGSIIKMPKNDVKPGDTNPKTTPLLAGSAKADSIFESAISDDITTFFDPEGFNPTKGNPVRKNMNPDAGNFTPHAYLAPFTLECNICKNHDAPCPNVLDKKDIEGIYLTRSNIIKNLLKSKLCNYVFLDCGKWKGEDASFGLIWGRHVYLCEFTLVKPKAAYPVFQRIDGPDYKFFMNFRSHDGKYVEIIHSTYCFWGLDEEYDFDNLHVIIPDLHLLSPMTAKYWQSNAVMPDGTYTMEAELKLLEFSESLIAMKDALGCNLKVIQLGDSYDLWIDFGFVSEHEKVNLIADIEKICADGADSDNVIAFAAIKKKIYTSIVNYEKHPTFKQNENLQLEIFSIPGKNNFTRIVEIDDYKKEVKNSNLYRIDRTKLEQKWSEWCDNQRGGLSRKNKNAKLDIKDCFYDEKTTATTFIQDQIKRIEGLHPDDTLERFFQYSHPFGVDADFRTHYRNYIKKIGKKKDGPYRNPAVEAFSQLEKSLGNNMVYLYGNHDNYLADSALTKELKMRKRDLIYESKSLYIEHGHRCEFEFKLESPEFYDPKLLDKVDQAVAIGSDILRGNFFTGKIRLGLAAMFKGGVPMNYDGCRSGFDATCDNLKDKLSGYFKQKVGKILDVGADGVAAVHDQPSYKKTFSRLKIGRTLTNHERIPNIFVIGHTHTKCLEVVTVKSYSQEQYITKTNIESRALRYANLLKK